MKRKEKKVAIISRESDSKTLDVAMLEEELLKRGVRVKVLSKLLTKEKSIRALGYLGHVMKQEAAILASDVVVLDTYCIPASMIPHRKGTKVIQMWHALGAIKKFGWQTVGKEGGSSAKTARSMRMHHGYDFVTCASDVTAEHFCEAFKVSRNKIAKYGLPRIDYVKSVAVGSRRDETAAKILAKYPQLKSEKQTILYAPTFRRGKAVDVKSLADALDSDRFDLVVKLHPLYRANTAGQEDSSGSIIYDEAFSSYDWLSVADIIISDYSSLVIEATLADKPLYIYAYDLEEYEANTGLNVDFTKEPIAKYVYRDAGELAKAVSDISGSDRKGLAAQTEKTAEAAYDLSALRAFRDRYIDIDTDNCTVALADFIESL